MSVWLHDNFNFIFPIMMWKHDLDWTLHWLTLLHNPPLNNLWLRWKFQQLNKHDGTNSTECTQVYHIIILFLLFFQSTGLQTCSTLITYLISWTRFLFTSYCKKSEYRSYRTVTTLLSETQARLCFKNTKA